MENTKKYQLEYNDIPVHYCKKCLSLKILIFNNEVDYCGDCSSADVGVDHIDDVLEKQNKVKLANKKPWEKI